MSWKSPPTATGGHRLPEQALGEMQYMCGFRTFLLLPFGGVYDQIELSGEVTPAPWWIADAVRAVDPRYCHIIFKHGIQASTQCSTHSVAPTPADKYTEYTITTGKFSAGTKVVLGGRLLEVLAVRPPAQSMSVHDL